MKETKNKQEEQNAKQNCETISHTAGMIAGMVVFVPTQAMAAEKIQCVKKCK